MNTERIIQLITDAVTDAVRERLPDLIGRYAKAVYDPICERVIKAEAALADASDKAGAGLLALAQAVEHDRAAVPEQIRTEISTAAANQTKAIYDPLCERVKNVEAALARLAANAVPAEALEAVRREVRALAGELSTTRAALAADAAERIESLLTAKVAALTLPAGPPGAEGAPGRDATFIAPVPYVPGAEVERGTIVRFEHALWYAHTKTNAAPSAPGSGYTLVIAVPFPDRCEADSSGMRVLVYREAGTEDLRVSLGFRPPTYAGVFDATRNYFENESVTYDGSRWVARRDSLGLRPGTDAGALVWTLEVKRGKDGRDGRDGPEGAMGPVGPRGEPGPPGVAPAPKRKAANGAAP